jgi:hypothetical protein
VNAGLFLRGFGCPDERLEKYVRENDIVDIYLTKMGLLLLLMKMVKTKKNIN